MGNGKQTRKFVILQSNGKSASNTKYGQGKKKPLDKKKMPQMGKP